MGILVFLIPLLLMLILAVPTSLVTYTQDLILPVESLGRKVKTAVVAIFIALDLHSSP